MNTVLKLGGSQDCIFILIAECFLGSGVFSVIFEEV